MPSREWWPKITDRNDSVPSAGYPSAPPTKSESRGEHRWVAIYSLPRVWHKTKRRESSRAVTTEEATKSKQTRFTRRWERSCERTRQSIIPSAREAVACLGNVDCKFFTQNVAACASRVPNRNQPSDVQMGSAVRPAATKGWSRGSFQDATVNKILQAKVANTKYPSEAFGP